MGQGLESGIGGYWSVSMQNLYTAAAALNNVKGIDLRGHPGFGQAVYYPLLHEVTVPGVGMFREPIDPKAPAPVMGVIGGKPIELPGAGAAICGPWWLDYAVHFPDSPAHYFASKGMIGTDRLNVAECHQGVLASVLTLAWWNEKLWKLSQAPRELALFTDRIANVRSGYGFGDTCLYFNGDLFLSAKKEILGCTSGMSWHFPWHQYQVTETGVETEGELFAPSMIIEETGNDDHFTFFRARSGFSNVAYYPLAGQRESYKHYERRNRSILYVRGGAGRRDYFVFLDDVRQPKPRWHAWTWHLWNHLENPKNYGRFVVENERAVRAERPNADLWIQFLAPGRVALEQHGIPSQPHLSYPMDHHAQMMRAIAGGYQPVDAKPVVIGPDAWDKLGVVAEGALYVERPPTGKSIAARTTSGITGGVRYRWSLRCKEQDYRAYEATAWAIDLELLDAGGRVVAKPTTPYGHPNPLRLGAPASDLPTHDWLETAQYFDAPTEAVACRATFHAVDSAHYFKLGKLWLSPIELKPVGRLERSQAQTFVTLVMPLNKGAPAPAVTTDRDGRTLVSHPDGTADEVVVKEGRLHVSRHKAGKEVASFHGGIKGADALKSNSEASARSLAAGLKPVLEQLRAERDAHTLRGRKNLARGAKVTASATRDERFAPSRVVDNETAEYPTDGHLDYTLGVVWSSGRFVGYGSDKESLLSNRDYWPFYIRPTYWLLPEETLGHIEVELPEPATVDLVRVLNTNNAGLNDFAAHAFRVELFDRNRTLLGRKEGRFGKPFDRPFEQAFVLPKWFSRYTPSFAGMLEPKVTVPFGDGWKEIPVEPVKGVVFVRVVITKYWGIAGGLNEVQVYGK